MAPAAARRIEIAPAEEDFLGVAQSIGFAINPGWGILAGHFVFLAVLLWRPTGLFARSAA